MKVVEEETLGGSQLKLQGFPSSHKLHMRFLKLLGQKGLQCCFDSWPKFMLFKPTTYG